MKNELSDKLHFSSDMGCKTIDLEHALETPEPPAILGKKLSLKKRIAFFIKQMWVINSSFPEEARSYYDEAGIKGEGWSPIAIAYVKHPKLGCAIEALIFQTIAASMYTRGIVPGGIWVAAISPLIPLVRYYQLKNPGEGTGYYYLKRALKREQQQELLTT